MLNKNNALVPMEISGALGGKGGGSAPPPPINSPETLHSKQTVRLLFAINDGQIKDQIPEVYLNGALSTNFDVDIDWRRGTLTQSRIPGFSDVESAMGGLSSPIQITQDTPYTSPELLYDVSAVRLALLLPQMKQIKPNGDNVGNSVSHSIYVRKIEVIAGIPYPGTWQFVLTNTKSGKASNPYSWDIRITAATQGLVLATADRWQFKIVRGSPDDIDITSSTSISATYLKSVTQIYEAVNYTEELLSYSGTALLAITINDPSQFGNSFPEVTFRTYLSEIYLPVGYDPIARTYPGIWDGSFSSTLQWSDNPGWALYNSLCRLPAGFQLDPADVDVGSFYLYAQYCDELVSDGKGGTEPRYRIDIHFTERMSRNTYLTYLLSLGNAVLGENLFGQIAVSFDRAGQEISHTVSNATVLNGKFTWLSNDVEARTSVVNITFNDELQKGLTNTATQVGDADNLVAGQDLIATYGVQTADIILQGCIRESQAIRKARWAIWSNCIDTQLVTFRQMFEGATFLVGQKIQLLDQEEVSNSYYHAILLDISYSGGISTLTFDRSFDLTPANARESTGFFYLSGIKNDGTAVIEYQVNETDGTFSELTVVGTVDFYFPADILLQGKVIPWTMKIVNKKLDGDDWEITALQHTEDKFTYIDSGYSILVPTGDYADFNSYTTEPPVNLSVQELHVATATLAFTKLQVSWDWDLDNSSRYYVDFYASYTRDNQGYSQIGPIAIPGFDIPDPFPGIYKIIVWAVNKSTGVPSTALSYEYSYRVAAGTSTLNPPLTLLVENTAGTVFEEPNCAIYWQFDPDNHLKTDALKDYKIEILDFATLIVKNEFFVDPLDSLDGKFNFTYELNRLTFGNLGARQFYVKVYSRDLLGDLSDPITASFSNPAPSPANFSYSTTVGISAIYFLIQASTEKDVVRYVIQKSIIGDFSDAVIVADSPDTAPVIPIEAGITTYFRIAAGDTFGLSGLVYGSPISTMALNAEIDKIAWQSLAFTPNDPGTNQVSWATAYVTINGGSLITVPAGNTTWTTGTVYLCFDKTTGTIVAETSLLTAVQHTQILASYEGGVNLKGGDGTAFFNGNQLLAQSVGANQLVADTAIITGTAQIAAEIVDISHINSATIAALSVADHIESTNYSSTRKEGFRLDTTGLFETYGKIKIGTQNVGVGTATSTFVPGALTLNGNALLNNSIIKKQGTTTAWDEQGYSSQSYTGNCLCSFSFAQDNAKMAAGFSLTPASAATDTSINYAIRSTGTGEIEITASGTIIANSSSSPVFSPGPLTLNGNATLGADSISKLSGTPAFDTQGYSTESYVGNCGVRFRAGNTTSDGLIALNTDPTTDANYASLDFAMELVSGNINVWESGANRGVVGTYTVSDDLEIAYKNGSIIYYKNGTALRTVTSVASATWFVDSSLYSVGASIVNIVFGAYSVPAEDFAYTMDDYFKLDYSGTTIDFYKNSQLLWTETVSAGQTFFFDSSIYTQNAIIDQIKFGQYEVLTPDYGARMEISGEVIKIFDRNDVLRFKAGNLNA